MVRVYCICLDGAPPNLLSRFSKDGTMPNLGKILSNGSWSRALPSIPTVTSVNWTTMVTGLHCGTHGRPYADQRLKYFWEAAEENGIPVGLANIEHNETKGSTFFVGHAKMLSDAITKPIKPGETTKFAIRSAQGLVLTELECSVSDMLEARIEGSTKCEIRCKTDTMSDYILFRGSNPEHTQICTRIKYNTGASSLYISPLRSTSGFADPETIEKEIISFAGPPPVRGFPLFHKQLADLDTALEEEMYHAIWFGKVAAYMMSRHDDALWFHRHNTTDGVGHFYLGLLDPQASSYDPGNLSANWSAIRRWYGTVDSILDEILKIDPQARFAMCTDHGNVGYRRLVSLARLFVDNGLSYPNKEIPKILDQRGSKLLISSNEIFINSDSRDPPGPVPREEYEDVRTKTIELLRNLVDPENSCHVVSIAIRREEAKSLLFWGKTRGDIIYFLTSGYLCPGPYIMKDVFQDLLVPGHTSEHFGCLPGYETDIGSTYSFIAFSGYTGGERNVENLGPVHLVDFAPTVLAMFSVSAPWLHGRVLREMIGPIESGDKNWEPETPTDKQYRFHGKDDWLDVL